MPRRFVIRTSSSASSRWPLLLRNASHTSSSFPVDMRHVPHLVLAVNLAAELSGRTTGCLSSWGARRIPCEYAGPASLSPCRRDGQSPANFCAGHCTPAPRGGTFCVRTPYTAARRYW